MRYNKIATQMYIFDHTGDYFAKKKKLDTVLIKAGTGFKHWSNEELEEYYKSNKGKIDDYRKYAPFLIEYKSIMRGHIGYVSEKEL